MVAVYFLEQFKLFLEAVEYGYLFDSKSLFQEVGF
jgi:hypothetical protein